MRIGLAGCGRIGAMYARVFESFVEAAELSRRKQRSITIAEVRR